MRTDLSKRFDPIDVLNYRASPTLTDSKRSAAKLIGWRHFVAVSA
jgi:hypothetical protein